jgi:hypothetical protein
MPRIPSADVIRREFAKIIAEHGTVDYQLAVNAARRPENPLHEAFTWEDPVAGEKYRVEVEAPRLFRTLAMPTTMSAREYRSVGMVSVPSTGGWQTVESVSKNDDQTSEVLSGYLEKAERRLQDARDMAYALDAGVAKDIVAVLEMVRRIAADVRLLKHHAA